MNGGKSLYISFNRINGYIEEHNGRKDIILIPVDENKCETKRYRELWKKIKYFIVLENNDFLVIMMLNTWN